MEIAVALGSLLAFVALFFGLLKLRERRTFSPGPAWLQVAVAVAAVVVAVWYVVSRA